MEVDVKRLKGRLYLQILAEALLIEDPDDFEEEFEGVYVVVCKEDGAILDVGESQDLRRRLLYHERAECWEEECSDEPLFLIVPLEDREERRALENLLRTLIELPCGER